MNRWTSEQLDAIAAVDELEIATPGRDGIQRRPIPVWVVRHGDALFVRAYRGTDAAWYRSARVHGRGRIRAGGVEAEVTFHPVAGHEVNAEVDAAYREKYARYGPRFVDPMIAPAARGTTLQLVPRAAEELSTVPGAAIHDRSAAKSS